MKSKKIVAVVVALFVAVSSSFAFDGKTFWKEYGGGLKNGDSLIHAGVGLSGFGNGGWFIPPVSVGYEKLVHINDMLPFSFGGMAAVSGYGYSYDYADYSDMTIKTRRCSYLNLDVAATARYHFNFGIDKLDVYAGFMAGLSLGLDNNEKLDVHPGFLWGASAGASWFFTDKIAASADFGYPYYINAKFTMKL